MTSGSTTLRHIFASWYMRNGGDLYELAKSMGRANIKMTARYAKLGRAHITKNWNHGEGDLEHDEQEHAGAGRSLRNSEHRLMFAYCSRDENTDL